MQERRRTVVAVLLLELEEAHSAGCWMLLELEEAHSSSCWMLLV
jgi:hypothetical protein